MGRQATRQIELGCLPLALEQAGAFIKTTGRPFSYYLEKLRSNKLEVLSKFKPLEYPEPVSRTWDISFREAEKTSKLSVHILYLCSFLASDRIPISLLDRAEMYLVSGGSSPAFKDDLDEALQVLNSYSLMTLTAGDRSIHRLVQDVIRGSLAEEDKKLWAGAAVKMLNDVFPKDHLDNVQSWAECSILLPHALAAAGHGEELGVELEATGRLLNECGLYLRTLGEFKEARSALERALVIDEKVYGPDHPTVARDVNNLGLVLRALGELAEARRCFERALKIFQARLGENHPYTKTVRNNLKGQK